MARIRSLKPEHKTHRKVGQLTDREYRLWVGMITEADDAGRLVGDIEQLRVTIFPYQRKTTAEDIEMALSALAAQELIRIGETSGVRYVYFPSWEDHQKINRPSKSKLPPYKQNSEDSLNTHGIVNDPSLPIKDQGSRIKESIKDQGSSSEANDLALYLQKLIAAHSPKALITVTHIRNWTGEADRLLRLDKRDFGEAKALLRWCHEISDFWRSNILSMSKFREKYDQLRLKAQEQLHKSKSPGQKTMDAAHRWIEKSQQEVGNAG